MKKLTASQQATIASKRASGVPAGVLASEYGVSKATIYRTARETWKNKHRSTKYASLHSGNHKVAKAKEGKPRKR